MNLLWVYNLNYFDKNPIFYSFVISIDHFSLFRITVYHGINRAYMKDNYLNIILC